MLSAFHPPHALLYTIIPAQGCFCMPIWELPPRRPSRSQPQSRPLGTATKLSCCLQL